MMISIADIWHAPPGGILVSTNSKDFVGVCVLVNLVGPDPMTGIDRLEHVVLIDMPSESWMLPDVIDVGPLQGGPVEGPMLSYERQTGKDLQVSDGTALNLKPIPIYRRVPVKSFVVGAPARSDPFRPFTDEPPF